MSASPPRLRRRPGAHPRRSRPAPIATAARAPVPVGCRSGWFPVRAPVPAVSHWRPISPDSLLPQRPAGHGNASAYARKALMSCADQPCAHGPRAAGRYTDLHHGQRWPWLPRLCQANWTAAALLSPTHHRTSRPDPAALVSVARATSNLSTYEPVAVPSGPVGCWTSSPHTGPPAAQAARLGVVWPRAGLPRLALCRCTWQVRVAASCAARGSVCGL